MASFFNNVKIVLVSPQIPENIGLTARIMKNMDFGELVLVNPPDLRKAYDVSKRARDVLDKAKSLSCLKDATEDASFVFASTRRKRQDSQIYNLKSIIPFIYSVMNNSKIAVLFGREDFGLSKKDIEQSDIVFRIPSSQAFPSFNLSFSVCIFCYELFCFTRDIYQLPVLNYANKKEINKTYEYLDDVLFKLGLGSSRIPQSRRISSSIKRIFNRAHLTKRETELLKSIFLKIKAKLN